MGTLKLIICGEILSLLLKFHPHQDKMNEGELKDYEALKRCAVILNPNAAEILKFKNMG
ncbi:MAG: hypothetical protein PHP53_07385 [Prolixibacteraceae bacterium]|nr:hypothetical protein [Prolixibacteraceae bacterium]